MSLPKPDAPSGAKFYDPGLQVYYKPDCNAKSFAWRWSMIDQDWVRSYRRSSSLNNCPALERVS